MNYIEIESKTALSASNLEGTDYSLNPYIGCQHACTYCYAPYVLHKDPESWNNTIYVKKNLPKLLQKEIKKKNGTILISSVTDPYQPAEKIYNITRQALLILKDHDNKVSILTKSALILRDFEVIEKIKDVQVGVSFSTLNELLKQRLEPASSSIAERLKILQKFENINTYVMIAPMTNQIEGEMETMAHTFKNLNVSYIITDRFRMRESMPPRLREEFVSATDYSRIYLKFVKISERYNIRVL